LNTDEPHAVCLTNFLRANQVVGSVNAYVKTGTTTLSRQNTLSTPQALCIVTPFHSAYIPFGSSPGHTSIAKSRGKVGCVISQDNAVTIDARTGSPAGPEPRCKPYRLKQADRISEHLPIHLLSMSCVCVSSFDVSPFAALRLLHRQRIANHDPSSAGTATTYSTAASRI
jgi:hypothetical protein